MYLRKAIYKIENQINHKIYIGQTIHPEKRWWEHKQRARTHTDNLPIHLAIDKYGEENFIFTVLEWTDNYNLREQELIQEYNSLCPNGYNISSGGSNNVMYGEDHPRNTVLDDIVLQIIDELYNNKLSDRQIAKQYNVSDKVVSDINHGRSHIKEDISYPIRSKSGLQKLTLEQVGIIKGMLKNTTMSYEKIASIYNVSKGVIYHINKGLTFVNENEIYPLRAIK